MLRILKGIRLLRGWKSTSTMTPMTAHPSSTQPRMRDPKERLDQASIESMFAALGLASAEDRAQFSPSNFGLLEHLAPMQAPVRVASHTGDVEPTDAKLAPAASRD